MSTRKDLLVTEAIIRGQEENLKMLMFPGSCYSIKGATTPPLLIPEYLRDTIRDLLVSDARDQLKNTKSICLKAAHDLELDEEPTDG